MCVCVCGGGKWVCLVFLNNSGIGVGATHRRIRAGVPHWPRGLTLLCLENSCVPRMPIGTVARAPQMCSVVDVSWAGILTWGWGLGGSYIQAWVIILARETLISQAPK